MGSRPQKEMVTGSYEYAKTTAGTEEVYGKLSKMEQSRSQQNIASIKDRMAVIESKANENGEVKVSDLDTQDRSVLIRGLQNHSCKIKKEESKSPTIVLSEADAIDSMF